MLSVKEKRMANNKSSNKGDFFVLLSAYNETCLKNNKSDN